MSRTLKVTPRHIALLKALASGDQISDIIKHVGGSRTAIYKLIRSLEKHGYLKTEKVSSSKTNYYATAKAMQEIQKVVTFSTTPSKGLHSGLQRKHNLTFCCSIIDIPNEWKENYKEHVPRLLRGRAITYHTKPLNNWPEYSFQRDDITIRTTTKSVCFVLPDIYGEDIRLIMAQASEMLGGVMAHAEAVLGVKLAHPQKENIMVINQHNSFIYNEIAKFCLANHINMDIYDEQGHKRATVDNSHGLQELEFVNVQHQEEDSAKFQKTMKALLIGEIDFQRIQDKVDTTAVNLEEATGHLAAYEKQINVHIPAVQSMGAAAQDMGAAAREMGRMARVVADTLIERKGTRRMLSSVRPGQRGLKEFV
jgi:transposase